MPMGHEHLMTDLAAGVLAEERFFDSDGVAIRYLEAGRGEPVILVHGYNYDTEQQWVRTGVFGALAARYRVIGFDARGHGKSGKPHERRLYGLEMARDVTRLLDHLGLRRAHIVGYSMGGHIVANLLTMNPERFLTATLGGAAGRRNWTEADQRRVEIEAGEMEQGLMRTQLLRLWPKDRPLPTDEEIRQRSARSLAGKDALALAAVRRSNADQVVTDAQMAAVTVPTLAIVGTQDPYRKDLAALKVMMPQLELVTVPDATHGAAPSKPEFSEALLKFLAAHPAEAFSPQE
jgi:pimeloyl-ACP methyl ester carboxylesterase